MEVDDFGFSAVDPDEKVDRLELGGPDRRIARMWETIEPFLDNLARNPEKDIHWPDRDVKIEQFKKKLRDIMAGDP